MKTFEERKKDVDRILEKYLLDSDVEANTLIEAMNYSVRAGGKRLRPILLQSFGRMYGAPYKLLEPYMAAIEFIHTYSLVHDDLPAMDNDMLRRGKPTTHAKYGEAMAILAGDGLLSEAFRIMNNAEADALADADLTDPHKSIDRIISTIYATKYMAINAGVSGMVGGQSVDVETDKQDKDVTEEQLSYIYTTKTSALIVASMVVGALLSGLTGDDIDLITEAGNKIGLAFQIRDDILDITGDEATLGKSTGQDAKNGKSTYASIHGIEASEEAVKTLTEEAKDCIRRLEHVKKEEERQFILDLFDRLTERNA